MAEYTLWCFAQSGNTYKPALMLNVCGADWAPRFVDFFNGETRTPEFRKLNVMGEVPLLEHRDKRLAQSGVILDYLATTLGKFGWRDDDERREILRWILFDNYKLTSYTATLRYLRVFQNQTEGPLIEFLTQRSRNALGVLNTHLAGNRFAVGGRPTIADFSMCGYLYFDDEIGVDWNDFPNIGRWLGEIKAIPGWKHPYQMMPGHPLPKKG
jgi:glutathione S-transferase